jgi:hypothetical protein
MKMEFQEFLTAAGKCFIPFAEKLIVKFSVFLARRYIMRSVLLSIPEEKAAFQILRLKLNLIP